MNRAYNELSGRHSSGKSLILSTVSGVATTNTPLVSFFDRNFPHVGIITTKSFQVTPNPGNREPIICEPQTGSFGNSVGLKNPGMDVVYPQLKALREKGIRALLNVSVSASNPEDFITLIRKFDDIADMIELNFSCPHAAAGFGASIGMDCGIATSYVEEIRRQCGLTKALIMVKLTPNVDDIGVIARSVIDAGADGIVAINTVGPKVHIDPVSGTPILQNRLGGKGGMSGKWVFGRAVECITEIRRAVGENVPVIGMGGVQTGYDARKLVECGADAVGIGSAFGMVNQKDWVEYTDRVVKEYEGKETESSLSLFASERQMEYTRTPITKIEFHGNDTIILTLDGKLDCHAGQFAFLWLPGVGEKPFSVASNDPIVFIIKRRGIFTSALWDLKVGDDLYVRGLYGAEIENRISPKALLIAGGTGVAVLPALAEKLKKQNTEMNILVGTSDSGQKPLLEDELSSYGKFTCVADDGKPGRVLGLLDDMVLGDDTNVYLVGPEKFMAIAADRIISKGLDKKNIYLSMERSTYCGIGMCGECACGSRLTCQWGTFMEYTYLEKEAPQLIGK